MENPVLRYAITAFALIVFTSVAFPVTAYSAKTEVAANQVSLRFGRHRYSPGRSHSVLGVEYNRRFTHNLSLGAGADYLSTDFGGSATGFFGNRFSAGPNYQISFGCLPIDITPGVGFEYLRLRGSEIENEEAFGYYIRAKFLLRVMSAINAGMTFRRSWNRLESLGQEGALELQVVF